MPRESLANKRERAAEIVARLKGAYPGSKCSLDFDTVHQLMVATILSGQCTDVRVNMVTPELFRKYPSVRAFAEADIRELEEAVRSTGFYANKAKAIKKSAQQLIDEYNGEIPRTLDKLVTLAGDGRKTGSVIL
ncbi:endonuclease III, partial [candidate division GN15 bacterium]|nr:endonuclease III [candidate division GN15 bacterium]